MILNKEETKELFESMVRDRTIHRREKKAESARNRNDKAAASYWENPQICKYCGSDIELSLGKVSEVRRKNFCNRSCSATFNNKKRAKPKIKIKKEKFLIRNLSKGELKKRSSSTNNMHSTIRQDSRRVFKKSKKEKKCQVCGYDVHVDICHRKDVKDFGDEITIKEINELDNLIPLCKNHHWEFDNGKLSFLQIFYNKEYKERILNSSNKENFVVFADSKKDFDQLFLSLKKEKVFEEPYKDPCEKLFLRLKNGARIRFISRQMSDINWCHQGISSYICFWMCDNNSTPNQKKHFDTMISRTKEIHISSSCKFDETIFPERICKLVRN